MSDPILLVSRCGTLAEFVAAFRRYAERIGLFVPTSHPLPVARQFPVRVVLTTGEIAVAGDAEVVTSSPTAGLQGRPGMTIRLTNLDPASQAILGFLQAVRYAPAVPAIPDGLIVRPGAPVPAPILASHKDPVFAMAECDIVGDTGAAAKRPQAAVPPLGTKPVGGPMGSTMLGLPRISPLAPGSIPARPTTPPIGVPPIGKTSLAPAASPPAPSPAAASPPAPSTPAPLTNKSGPVTAMPVARLPASPSPSPTIPPPSEAYRTAIASVPVEELMSSALASEQPTAPETQSTTDLKRPTQNVRRTMLGMPVLQVTPPSGTDPRDNNPTNSEARVYAERPGRPTAPLLGMAGAAGTSGTDFDHEGTSIELADDDLGAVDVRWDDPPAADQGVARTSRPSIDMLPMESARAPITAPVVHIDQGGVVRNELGHAATEPIDNALGGPTVARDTSRRQKMIVLGGGAVGALVALAIILLSRGKSHPPAIDAAPGRPVRLDARPAPIVVRTDAAAVRTIDAVVGRKIDAALSPGTAVAPEPDPDPVIVPGNVVEPTAPSGETPTTADCAVTITSSPAKGDVYIGGKNRGRTPLTLQLPCEPVVVTVRHPQRLPATQKVRPKPGGLKKSFALAPILFDVKVSSKPTGATILVDGKAAGKTPTTVKVPGFVAAKIGFEKAGYVGVTQTVTAKQNGTAVQATLKKR